MGTLSKSDLSFVIWFVGVMETGRFGFNSDEMYDGELGLDMLESWLSRCEDGTLETGTDNSASFFLRGSIISVKFVSRISNEAKCV